MSTKTSIKRVALVAAAALTIGGFSAVSAHAVATPALPFYVSAADSGVQTSSTATAAATSVAGPYNYIKLASDATALAAYTTIGVSVSGASATVAVSAQPTTAGSAGDTLTVNGTSTGVTSAHAATTLGGSELKIFTPSAGTVTITISKNVDSNGQVTTTVLQTITVAVNAASVVGAFSGANSFANLVETATVYTPKQIAVAETGTLTSSTVDGTTPVYKGDANAPAAQVAIVAVHLLDTQSTPAALAGKSVSASITPVGLISGTGANSDTDTVSWASVGSPLTGASSTTDAQGWAWFQVLTSGSSGTATMTFKYTDAAGVVYTVATKTITFYSKTVASITVAAPNATIPLAAVTGFTPTATEGISFVRAGGHVTGTTDAAAVSIVAKDANTNAISGADETSASTLFTVTSSNTAVATVGSVYYDATNAYFYPVITPVSAGTTTITVVDAATGLVSGSVAITVASAVVASVVPGFGASSYDPGTKVSYTLTIANAKAVAVPNGTYAQFFTKGSAPISSVGVQGTVSGESITTVNGVATSTFYAPLQGGNVLITGGVLGASTTIFATALQSATLADATFSVNGSSDASAATDAANAATDAANAAADAADNATQAASEALAAVNSLATTVASLIAGIKAQITSLTNLITKIKNKVGA
jgi:hypothetical protein